MKVYIASLEYGDREYFVGVYSTWERAEVAGDEALLQAQQSSAASWDVKYLKPYVAEYELDAPPC